ncbi:MAG: hypothetical protein AAFX58_15525, partial [Pseudomonadota bacterium]
MTLSRLLLLVLAVAPAAAWSQPPRDDDRHYILVTFENTAARAPGGHFSAPYRARKRYSIARTVQRDARAIETEYALTPVDEWPIRALSVYC